MAKAKVQKVSNTKPQKASKEAIIKAVNEALLTESIRIIHWRNSDGQYTPDTLVMKNNGKIFVWAEAPSNDQNFFKNKPEKFNSYEEFESGFDEEGPEHYKGMKFQVCSFKKHMKDFDLENDKQYWAFIEKLASKYK